MRCATRQSNLYIKRGGRAPCDLAVSADDTSSEKREEQTIGAARAAGIMGTRERRLKIAGISHPDCKLSTAFHRKTITVHNDACVHTSGGHRRRGRRERFRKRTREYTRRVKMRLVDDEWKSRKHDGSRLTIAALETIKPPVPGVLLRFVHLVLFCWFSRTRKM